MVGGISGWQLLILLLIVVLVFGTKRLRNIGGDLGSAVKGFRKGMEEDPDAAKADAQEQLAADPEPEASSADPTKDNEPAQRPPGTDV